MNCSKLLLFLCSLSSISTLTHQPKLMQQTAVVRKSAAIHRQMSGERYVVYSLMALSMAQVIYPWMVMLQNFSVAKEAPVETVVVPQSTLSMWEKIKANSKAAFNHLFCTKEGWSLMAQIGCAQASSIIISRVCDKFVHPDTLRWYVHAHAAYALTIAMMQERLLIMQDVVFAQQPLDDHKQYMQLLYDRLVQQGESACAYMTYKCARLDDEEKDLAKRAVRSMFNSQNSWFKLIAERLSSDTFDYHIINSLLVAYEADVASQIQHFSVIEGETLQERYIVKQLIKRSA